MKENRRAERWARKVRNYFLPCCDLVMDVDADLARLLNAKKGVDYEVRLNDRVMLGVYGLPGRPEKAFHFRLERRRNGILFMTETGPGKTVRDPSVASNFCGDDITSDCYRC